MIGTIKPKIKTKAYSLLTHSNQRFIKHNVGLLNLAQACKITGVSHDNFYRYKSAADEGGVERLEKNKHDDDACGEISLELGINSKQATLTSHQ